MGSLEKALKNYVTGSSRGWALIRHSGIYDLELLTGKIREWFLNRTYLMEEREHSEAVKTSGKELKFDIAAFRKVSDYVIFHIDIETVILRNLDILVEEDGKKVKKQQGDMDIRIKAYIGKNYQNTFKGGIQEFLRIIYERFIARSVLRNYRIKLSKETESLIEEIKEVLGMTK